jgi:hypothetical protein
MVLGTLYGKYVKTHALLRDLESLLKYIIIILLLYIDESQHALSISWKKSIRLKYIILFLLLVISTGIGYLLDIYHYFIISYFDIYFIAI